MKKTTARVIASLVLMASVCSAHAVGAAPRYTLTQLQPLIDPPLGPLPPGWLSPISLSAKALNNAGQVAGAMDDARFPKRVATVWSGGTPESLGRLSDLSGSAFSVTEAVAINDAGLVVVNINGTASGSGAAVATVRNGQATLLGDGFASSVNEQGTVGGVSSLTRRATLWTPAGTTDLGTAGGSSSGVSALSNTGLAVGSSTLAGDPTFQCMPFPQGAPCTITHAMIWSMSGPPVELGVLGGVASYAVGVNDSGHVVGRISYAGGLPSHSFFWDGATMVDMGPVVISDINNDGVMVGATRSPQTGTTEAAVWMGGTSIQLSSLLDQQSSELGWSLRQAYAINDRGQILVGGLNDQYQSVYVVLTPVDEPSSLALLCAGLFAVRHLRSRANRA